MQRVLGELLYRLGQIVRRIHSERDINSRQMLSIQCVKFRVVRGAVLRAVPPAPVAAFRREQRFFGSCERFDSWRALPAFFLSRLRASVSFARVPQKFPGRDVLAASDPDIEICIDPGRGKDSGVLRNFARRGDRFADRERREVRIALNAAIKFTQKISAVSRVIFPGIFAVEKKTNCQRTGGRNFFAKKAKPSVQIRSSGFAVHAAINECNQVGKMVVAEKSGDFLFPGLKTPRTIKTLRVRRQSTCIAEETDI